MSVMEKITPIASAVADAGDFGSSGTPGQSTDRVLPTEAQKSPQSSSQGVALSLSLASVLWLNLAVSVLLILGAVVITALWSELRFEQRLAAERENATLAFSQTNTTAPLVVDEGALARERGYIALIDRLEGSLDQQALETAALREQITTLQSLIEQQQQQLRSQRSPKPVPEAMTEVPESAPVQAVVQQQVEAVPVQTQSSGSIASSVPERPVVRADEVVPGVSESNLDSTTVAVADEFSDQPNNAPISEAIRKIPNTQSLAQENRQLAQQAARALRRGDYLIAADVYGELVMRDPDAAAWWLGFALSLQRAGDDEGARYSFLQVVEQASAGSRIGQFARAQLKRLG